MVGRYLKPNICWIPTKNQVNPTYLLLVALVQLGKLKNTRHTSGTTQKLFLPIFFFLLCFALAISSNNFKLNNKVANQRTKWIQRTGKKQTDKILCLGPYFHYGETKLVLKGRPEMCAIQGENNLFVLPRNFFLFFGAVSFNFFQISKAIKPH